MAINLGMENWSSKLMIIYKEFAGNIKGRENDAEIKEKD